MAKRFSNGKRLLKHATASKGNIFQDMFLSLKLILYKEQKKIDLVSFKTFLKSSHMKLCIKEVT